MHEYVCLYVCNSSPPYSHDVYSALKLYAVCCILSSSPTNCDLPDKPDGQYMKLTVV